MVLWIVMCNYVRTTAGRRRILYGINESCNNWQTLINILDDSNSQLRHQVQECVAPLLYAGFKYVDQAKAYCASDVCKNVVDRVKGLPACTWNHLPTDPDAETLLLVLQDCS